ncbi:MAG: hypothetical protein R3Y47_08785 [Lachnospiraceae bacterium]
MGYRANRKDQGFIHQILPVFFSIVVVLCIVIMSGEWMSVIRRRDEINQVARSYLLKMESTGYLQEEDKDDLLSLLGDMNISNIDLSGTTLSSVSYGDHIYLCIEGIFEYEVVELIPFQEKEYELLTMPFEIEMMSTAKH